MKDAEFFGYLDRALNTMPHAGKMGFIPAIHEGRPVNEAQKETLMAIAESGLTCSRQDIALAIFETYGTQDDLRGLVDDVLEKKSNVPEAVRASALLGDQDRLRRSVDLIIENHAPDYFTEAFSPDQKQEIRNRYDSFKTETEFECAGGGFELYEALNAAYELKDQYDVVVGVAKGGLYSSFVFDLIGIDMKLCEAHKKGEDETTFEWHSDFLEDLEGKRVLVLDKDVRSGRSLTRVVDELQQYSPAKVGVFFNHNPDQQLGSLLQNVPDGISRNNVHYPGKMDYGNFYEALVELQHALE